MGLREGADEYARRRMGRKLLAQNLDAALLAQLERYVLRAYASRMELDLMKGVLPSLRLKA